MGGWSKKWCSQHEEGLHQKPTQMERICWEDQNFFEVVAPQEEEDVYVEGSVHVQIIKAKLRLWNHQQ